jgi:hypothetical protein
LATRDQHLGDAAELYDDELSAGLRDQLAEELAAAARERRERPFEVELVGLEPTTSWVRYRGDSAI